MTSERQRNAFYIPDFADWGSYLLTGLSEFVKVISNPLWNETSQVTQWVKNPPAIQETQEMPVRILGQEDPLEEGMPTDSSILA